jgi:hypothetical protein
MSITLRQGLRVALLGGLVCLSAAGIPPSPAPIEVTTGAGETTPKWVCEKADNICGLDDAKTLSNPAKVDYDGLLKATPEYKKIRDEKIDANSAEGIQLRQKAAERVRDACEKTRVDKSYCSVWKTIKHTDGRAIPDITDTVKEQL